MCQHIIPAIIVAMVSMCKQCVTVNVVCYFMHLLHLVSLLKWIEDLPPGYFVSCDCAYSITEHLIGPYSGPERFLEKNDAFNFYLSQLRIRIEMCFGLMVTKWRILTMPLCIKLCNISLLFGAIARLHNFCINEREAGTKLAKVYRVPSQMQHPHEPTMLGYVPSDAPNVTSREGSSVLRDVFSTRIHRQNLKCPLTETLRNALVQKRKGLFE